MAGFKEESESEVTDVRHIPKFGGELWFVSAGISASGTGKSPDIAFKTIGEAITASSAGDAITVMQGTYVENGIDISKDGLEVWFEIGSIIANTTGHGLVVSGDYCKVLGQLLVTPGSGSGLVINATGCYFESIKVVGGTNAFDSTESGNEFVNCRCVGQSIAGFYIRGDQQRLKDCSTVGSGGSTIGYYMTFNCENGLLDNCTSLGHGSGGFVIATGSSGWTILNCSSGSGDGKWLDADSSNVWSGFKYPKTKYATVVINTDNDDQTTQSFYNLFKVIGAVRILKATGHITTSVTVADLSNVGLRVASVSVSDVYISTENISTFARNIPTTTGRIGSVIERNAKASEQLDFISSHGVNIDDSAAARYYEFVLVEDKDIVTNTTYLQFGTDISATTLGTIHWHIVWEAITDDGFLEAV